MFRQAGCGGATGQSRGDALTDGGRRVGSRWPLMPHPFVPGLCAPCHESASTPLLPSAAIRLSWRSPFAVGRSWLVTYW